MTSTARVSVLSHMGDDAAMHLPPDLASRVVVTPVAMHGVPDAGVRGEVLVTIPTWPENTDELLARGVRWMHYISTGVDRVDFGALPADLLVTNSRGASAVPISEWVVAVMLAFEKRLPEIWLDEPPANWRADPHLGTLYGRRVAIVGFGAIGEAVARRLVPFGTEVVGLRRTLRPSDVEGVEVVGSLEAALDGADHVVLAAPHTPATHHLIGQAAFATMKPGVHLVNIARGGLVDQDALRVALDDGIVAMASLDAVDPEPLPDGHWMFTHPKVRVSAHDSWSWPSAMTTIFDRFAVNLRAYLAGEPLPDRVDFAQGY
ncbi:MAG TPA: NAD(P)-dependent oxidoreductase [Acidimicrobiales bacterium]|nr:NAD(P)-dependent oxidoreductase [Acidimicrobiales bacterium]